MQVSDLTLKRIYAVFLVVVASYYLLISTERGRSWLYGKAATSPESKPRALADESRRKDQAS
jgi:hypothetical protein